MFRFGLVVHISEGDKMGLVFCRYLFDLVYNS